MMTEKEKLVKTAKKIEDLQNLHKELFEAREQVKLVSKKIDHWFATLEDSGLLN